MWDNEKLKEARLRAGFETQSEVARILNTSSTYINSIENGKRTPGVKLVQRMAKLYRVQIPELLELK